MKIKFKGHTYAILRKKVIPIGIVEQIPDLKGAPTDNKQLHINGHRLEGKVALVTGGYRGIGYQIALRLLKDGAKVVITGRNEEQLKKTIAHLNTSNLSYLVWDITDKDTCSHFKKAISIYGKVDILINNAGVTSNTQDRPSFEEMDIHHYHYVHDINTLGTTKMCEEFANLVSSGTILNIISNTAVLPACDAYFTSKWALYSYTMMIGNQFAQKGLNITVNGLCPGPTKSPMTPATNLFRKEIPNHRIGLPEEIAELCFIQVLSGLNGQNGEITICDGGQIYRL